MANRTGKYSGDVKHLHLAHLLLNSLSTGTYFKYREIDSRAEINELQLHVIGCEAVTCFYRIRKFKYL